MRRAASIIGTKHGEAMLERSRQHQRGPYLPSREIDLGQHLHRQNTYTPIRKSGLADVSFHRLTYVAEALSVNVDPHHSIRSELQLQRH